MLIRKKRRIIKISARLLAKQSAFLGELHQRYGLSHLKAKHTLIILLTSGAVQMEAVLNESKTAALLFDKLPISGTVNTWGDEIYFPVPVEAEAENAATLVEEGDLAYSPDGRSLCSIFFGPTPASTSSEIRPASPVNLLGRLKGDPKLWKKVEPGSTTKLEKA